jgi:opacity protein-like surface antigen
MTKNFLKITIASIIFSISLINLAKAENKFYVGIDASRQKLDIDLQPSVLDDRTVFSPKSDDFYKTTSIAPQIFAGLVFDDAFKIEASFLQTNESKINNNTGMGIAVVNNSAHVVSSSYKGAYPVSTNFKIKNQAIALDLKPYIKFNDKFLGFFIAGVSYNKIDINQIISVKIGNTVVSDSTSQTISKVSPSIGFGLEYFVIPNLTLRTQFKYTAFVNKKSTEVNDEKEDQINGISNLNLGVAYYF